MAVNSIRRWIKSVVQGTKVKQATKRRFQPAVEQLEDRWAPAVVITEVDPSGSGATSGYAADWFEVTNTGPGAVNVTGWKMDDNSNGSPTSAQVPLSGVTSIAEGESVIFIETSGANNATIIANFKTAWFGASPPATLQVGTYTGAGVGLSTTTDAVNLFDSTGNRVTGVSFGAVPAGSPIPTFDNTLGLGSSTLPLPTLTVSSVSGVDGAAASANGAEIGSPGHTFTTVDLSRYVRVGRYDLPEPTRTTPPDGFSLLAQEASSVTYNWDTDTLFVVGDGGTSVVQVSKTGQLINSMTLAPGSSPQGTDFYDTEGITYVGAGKFVMTEERYRQINLFTYVAGATLHHSDAQTVKLGTTIGNIGLEGVTYDPATGGYILVKEKDPQGIFQTGVDFVAGTATNGSPTTTNSTNLFNPSLAGLSDFSDVYALSNLPNLNGTSENNHLLVLSQESGQIVNIDRSGTVFSRLTIVGDAGNPLSVPDQTHEGVTMDRNGYLYVVSENGGGDANHPQLWVYAPSTAPNLAPTAVALINTVNSIPENTSTAAAVKVADISVTDDGLGTNNLSLSGADASSFQITGSALFLKAGTTLNYISKPTYNVTVNVDDPTVGSTPDATTNFTLTITAPTGGTPQVIISEVAPWSSGNSSLAADWFEATNIGTAAANITGWKMDDNSNSFGSSVALNGITSIAPGESVIFIELGSGHTAAGNAAAFNTLWFGANPPANLQIGSYGGSGVGLSTAGDAVNLFDAGGSVQANVVFGTSPAGPYPTFDNAAGLNNTTISTLSAVGVNGAFAAVNDVNEIGSPGTIGASSIPIVNISATDASAAEAGSDPGTFRITRSGSTVGSLTVSYTIAAGAGQAVAADYTPTLNGAVTIPSGQSFVDITITPVDDALVEGSETLTLTLGDTGSYDVGASPTATVTIADNDFPNQAPTAVTLNNTVPLMVESTSTASAIRVADIAITDDGQGTNTLSLSGADAASFQITGSSLYLKAGTALSYASKPTYNVTVNVDDTTVGSTPDASTNFTLTITQAVPAGSIIVSEVAPWSSSNSSLAADWFEVTNLGSAAISTTGWRMDDNSNLFNVSVPMSGVASIAPGESVIFIETAAGHTDSGNAAAFRSLWFGASPPAGLQVGSYAGSGVGLSSAGDAVNLYDASGNLITRVDFGASPAGPSFATFDNKLGLSNTTISQLSVVGVHGAFVAINDANEIGSPGVPPTPNVTIAATDASAAEVNGDPGVFRITRTGSTAAALTVSYTVATGAGQANSADYTPALFGTATIAAGQSFVNITITPVEDFLIEGSETVTLNLVGTANYDVGASASATVAIADNTVGVRPFLGVAAGDADASSVVLWTRVDQQQNVPVHAQVSTDPGFGGALLTYAGTSDSTKDYTVKVIATGLTAGTQYYYRFIIDATSDLSGTGTFKTVPSASAQVGLKFAFSGDMDGLMRPYALSSQVPAEGLDFYANLGDIIYENASNPAGNNGASYLNSPSVTLSGSSASLNGVPTSTGFATQQQLFDDYNKKYREQFLAVNTGGQDGLSAFYGGQGNYTLLDNHELGNRQYINGGAPAGGSVGGPAGTDMATGRGVDARANGTGNPGNVNDTNTSTSDYMNRSPGYLTLQQDYLNYEPIRENRANPSLPTATISAPSDPRTDGTKQLYFAQPWGANAVYIETDTRSYRDLRVKTANGSADDTGARADNPNRTYLGTTQLAWLEQQLLAAEQNGTPWKFVTLSDPIDEIGPIGGSLSGVTGGAGGTMTTFSGNAAYGPVSSDGGKAYIGGYRAERNALLKFIADNKIENVVFLATDDHQNRINEVTYSPSGQTGNQASYVAVPHVFSIVCGPLGATGPDLFLNHDFASVQGAANLIANAQIAAGVEPIGLMGYAGLHNVMREQNGVLVSEASPQAADFYSPDTFNYNTLQVSADGKTLTVTSKGIISTAQNAAKEYGANGNTVHTLFSFQVDAFNEVPIAQASSVATSEDTAKTFAVSDFHFTDVEGNALASITVSNLTLAAGDTLTVNLGAGAVPVTNGMTITAAQIPTMTYTPAANANGNARSSFSFTVNDGGLGTVAATMTINVTEVNDAPIGVNDSLSSVTQGSGQRTISFVSLLANDSKGPSNESGQTLTITNVGSAVGGAVSISGTDVLFTPTAGFYGLASFVYTLQDNGTTNGANDFKTSTATVSFTVQEVSSLPGVTTGPSSSAAPYVIPTNVAITITESILTTGDTVPLIGGAPGQTYRMAGIPDGLGAFDNGNGTFTLLMNHELGNTVGVPHATGPKGAFVSEWVIDKSTLQVLAGQDLMKTVYGWDAIAQTSTTAPIPPFAFNRFCSGDLPLVSAYYNAATGLGTQERIYMHGEEGGATGYQLGTVVTGLDAGKSYILGKFNLSTNGSGLTGVGAWENALANPFAQDKTVVIANSDGGTGIMTNALAVYVGTKTNTGSVVDKAGLTNGTTKFINVTGNPVEIINNTTRATNITNGTRFTLSGTASTTFSRPEDGAWNPNNPKEYFFVTTDRLDQVGDGAGAQIGQTRLWRLTFDDITNPDAGGKIDLLIDGRVVNGQKVNMFDNITVNPTTGHIILLEDVGNAAHNGKVWDYNPANDSLVQVAKHDPARFGDVGLAATFPFNQDEETSGVIDVSAILGVPNSYLLVDQAHYLIDATHNPNSPNPNFSNPDELVEGGQLLLVRVNTPPVAQASSVTTNEDNAKTFAVADFHFTDLEGNPLASITVSNLTLASGDTLTVNQGAGAVPVTNGMTITAAQIPTLIYTPAANANGNARSSLSFTVNDAGLGAVAATMTINVTAVNDVPVAQASSVTTNEDTAKTFAVANFLFNDVEGNSLASITVSNLSLAAGDMLQVNQGSGLVAVTNGMTITAAQIPSLTYTPASNANGNARSSFSFTVSDADPGTVAATMTINVTAVNDVPVAQASSVTTNEDTAKTFAVANFLFNDVEGNALASITVSNLSLASGDTLTVNLGAGAVPVTNGMTITAAQIPTLTYTPAANANGNARSSFSFTVNDADLGTVAATMTINVTAVNDVPVAQASSVTINEDTAKTFAVANFLFNDVEGNALASITVGGLSLAAGDTLKVDQGSGLVAVTNGMTITAAQIPTLIYTPAANASGNARSSFNFTVNDAGLGTVAATMTINVTAVADAPSLTVAPAAGVQGVPVPLNIQASLVDTDGSETLSIAISNLPAGATLSAGSNVGGVWTLTKAQLVGLTLNGASPGAFSLHVVATAKETSNNNTASTSADLAGFVAGVTLNNGVLTVLGTAGDDVVNIYDPQRTITVCASFLPGNHTQTFNLSAISKIVVLMGDGNDVALIDDDVRVTALIDGGRGNDVLQAGGGDTVLVGGEGNDVISGGKKRDILIGGLGSDILLGRGGQDILIGGTTSHDTNSNALFAAMAEWARDDLDLNHRMAHLRTGGGLNGSTVLTGGVGGTVQDDNAADILSGGSGNDWYWANINQDIFIGKKKNEVVN